MNRLFTSLVVLAAAACGLEAPEQDGAGGAVVTEQGSAALGEGVLRAAPPPPARRIEVNGPITADTTWSGRNTYILKQHIFVQAGTLTIQPGATIIGEPGSSLVITREARIQAVGTAAKPIVFTSAQPAGSRRPGDWGGVVLLGKAPINVAGGETYIEGFAANVDDRTKYGGPDAAHSCGFLKYARIEFAGFKLVNNNELNGLTMGGCGRGTEIDYVQVHKGADDGVEMFGGTADLKHVLVTSPDDDGLDWDFGYNGRVQFLVVQQDLEVGNYGIEADNNPNNKDASPRSMPEVWNVTLIGSSRGPGGAVKSGAMHLKNGTGGRISNAIVAHFSDVAIDVDGAPAVAAYERGELAIRNSIFWNLKGERTILPGESKDNDNGFDEAARLLDGANGSLVLDPMIGGAHNLAAPSFMPAAVSAQLIGAAPPADGFFDGSATFKGAMGTEDWTAGWTAFPAN